MSNPEQAIGYVYPALPVTWNQRDLLLYHAGIGGNKDELEYIYELHPNWQPFPILQLKGNNPNLNNFAEMVGTGRATPGLPKFDPNRLVHASQSIQIIRPLPTNVSDADGFKLTKRVVSVLDKGKGTVVEYEMKLVDKHGTEYTKMESSTYFFGKDMLNGYQKTIRDPSPLTPSLKPPARSPDVVIVEPTSPDQALVYRLSGDTNPLHADPKIGKAIGFGGVILHGLCSYGFAARAIIKGSPAKGDGRKLKYMYSRFSSPVKPGDILETSMWFTKVAGGVRVDFIEKVKGTGKICLSDGVAFIEESHSIAKI